MGTYDFEPLPDSDIGMQISDLYVVEQSEANRQSARMLASIYWIMKDLSRSKAMCGAIADAIERAWAESQHARSVRITFAQTLWMITQDARLKAIEDAVVAEKPGLAPNREAYKAIQCIRWLSCIPNHVKEGDNETAVFALADACFQVGELYGNFDEVVRRMPSGRKASPEREVFRQRFIAWKRGEAKHGKANKKGDFMLAMESQLQASDAQLAEWYKQAKRDFDAGRSGGN